MEDKAILSKATSYLESKSLIISESNQKKRYNNYFSLTDKGLIVAKSIANKIDNILGYASADIDDNNREIMYKSLLLISERLDKYCEKHEGEGHNGN